MPVVHTCLSCGAFISRSQSYCSAHRPRSRSAYLRGGGAGITAFRRAVGDQAGWQCEAVERGRRCEVRDPQELEAHHLHAISDGGSNSPTNGVLLCRDHHARLEGRRPPT